MSFFKISSPVTRSHILDEDDVTNTKVALNNLGYYEAPKEYGLTPYSDERMFDGMKQFQKDNNLRVDAEMFPGRETETTINAKLDQVASANKTRTLPPEPKCEQGYGPRLVSTCLPGTNICYDRWECVKIPSGGGIR